MKDIYIDVRDLWLYNMFKKDFVSIDELLDKCELMSCVIDSLEEELDDLKQDLKENYRPIKPEEQY